MFKTVLIAGITVASGAVFFSNETSVQEDMFQTFVREYGRRYHSEEESGHRFKVFVENLKVIDQRNEAEKRVNGQAIHGITAFSDLTQEEFSKGYLGSRRDGKTYAKNIIDEVPTASGAAGSVDWSGKYTTPVKDQGYCGSCWAFSATEQLESDAMRVLGSSYILSVEQTTQCTNYVVGGGCGGGFTESAYHYIQNTGGLVQDSDYPYTKTTYEGITGQCDVNTRLDVVSLTGFTQINGETNMANYMLATGPLSVCVAAEVWNSYTGGIMTTCPGGVDHCVQAVGVDTGANGYWKVRNSWGTRWGESGYIRLAYGKDTCKITDDATFVDPVMA